FRALAAPAAADAQEQGDAGRRRGGSLTSPPSMTGTALITGASSGIGLELAKLLARDGHDLVLVARRAERLEELGAELAQRHGIRYHAIALDLADADAPAEIVRRRGPRSSAAPA